MKEVTTQRRLEIMTIIEDVHALSTPKSARIMFIIKHEVGKVSVKPTLSQESLNEEVDVSGCAEYNCM